MMIYHIYLFKKGRCHFKMKDSRMTKTKIMNMPITNVGLSLRVVNALQASGIEKVKDLAQYNLGKLLMIPNIGWSCIKELAEFSKNKRVTLGFDADDVLKRRELRIHMK